VREKERYFDEKQLDIYKPWVRSIRTSEGGDNLQLVRIGNKIESNGYAIHCREWKIDDGCYIRHQTGFLTAQDGAYGAKRGIPTAQYGSYGIEREFLRHQTEHTGTKRIVAKVKLE
jgi:hypothetical protein